MRQRLDNKVVMITGAARGIGAETARRAAAKNARVSLVGLEPDRLRALADELGDRAAWFEADVTDQESMDGAVAGTVAAFGGIDVVLANAGVGNTGTVAISPRRRAACARSRSTSTAWCAPSRPRWGTSPSAAAT